MSVKSKLSLLILSLLIVLFFCSLLRAEDKFFSLKEKWSLELADTVRAIQLYDLNCNYSQDILIGAGSIQDCYLSCYGFVYIASDSARDVIDSSGELGWAVACIEAGDLDQNGTAEILAGMSDGATGGVCVFSDAKLDSQIFVPEDDFFPAVVSLKTVPMEDSTVVFLAAFYGLTSSWQSLDKIGCVYVGTGYLSDLYEIYWGPLVERIEFADSDVDQVHELILSNFYWSSMGMPGEFPASGAILIWNGWPGGTITTASTLFSFNTLWDIMNRGGFTGLEIGNCDRDSSLEILGSAFVDTCFPVYVDTCCLTVLSVVDGSTEVEQWRLTCFGKNNIISGIALVDFNNDGINEVLVAHKNAPVELLNGEDGGKIAESDSSFRIDHFAFGDVDGDGENEMVIAVGSILRVFEADFSPDVAEEEEDLSRPDLMVLSQNYPNPFNSTTVIPFTVYGKQKTERGAVPTNLTIYNILGQRVRTLLDEEKIPGNYRLRWDGKNEQGQMVPSGIYFYRLTAGKHCESKKMLFLK